MGHCRSARAFAVKPARRKSGAPLLASGLDRLARPSKGGLSCQKRGKAPCLLKPRRILWAKAQSRVIGARHKITVDSTEHI